MDPDDLLGLDVRVDTVSPGREIAVDTVDGPAVVGVIVPVTVGTGVVEVDVSIE